MTTVSKTTATLQVVTNPVLDKRISPIANVLFHNLHQLQADFVRYVPWFPYPRQGVAELDPPNTRCSSTSSTNQTTYWNFSTAFQQPFLDTFHAVSPKRLVINFSTQPTWMFNTTDWRYHDDSPGTTDWHYPKGQWEPRTTALVADYYGRLASWIILGQCQDEFGHWIQGGPALGTRVTHWEVFNEPEAEHRLEWREYIRMYDAVVRAIRIAADPDHRIEFFGLSLEGHNEWDWWTGFLTLENHAPDVQDAVANGYASFHWYGQVSSRTNVSAFMEPFEQLPEFLEEVDQIIALRDRLSPTTKLAVNEAGAIPVDDNKIGVEPSPPIYYNMVAALYTVLVSELSLKGVDVVGSSQFCGCPEIPQWNITDRQFPGVSMTNWTTGSGNPRYWALKMYLQYFGPGDQIVSASVVDRNIYVQARITKDGKHIVIVVNKTDQKQTLKMQYLKGSHVSIVDESTHDGPWKEFDLDSVLLGLDPFAVALVNVPARHKNMIASVH